MDKSRLVRLGSFGGLALAFAVIAGMPPMQAEGFKRDEVAAVWQRVDTDHDGTATHAELVSANSRLAESFARADADRDGFLDFREFEALLLNS
jgi:hypothetical protein